MGNISTTNIAENMETFTDIEKENYEKFNEAMVLVIEKYGESILQ